MAGVSRKNDPFNFDDIYRQAGVEDLFVKKTLGELKQSSTGPAPAASPSTATAPAPKPSSNAAAFDLDFLSTFASPGGTPPSLSKHSSAANITASSIGQQTRPLQQPTSASLGKPQDDPFALFEEVPGAAPVQPHAPPAAPPSHQTSGLGNLLDFDDGGATLAPGAAAGPSPPLRPLIQPQSAAVQLSSQSTGQLPSPSQQPPVAGPSHPPRPPDYAFYSDHPPAPSGLSPQSYDTPPQPYTTSGDARASVRQSETLSRLSRTSNNPGGPPFQPSNCSQPYHSLQSHNYAAYPPQPQQQPYRYSQEIPEPSNSSSSLSWHHSPSGSGISGALKAFGKKAVRVAKAGLAQLEAALEGLDHQHHGPGAESQGSGHPGLGDVSSGGTIAGRSGSASGRSYDDETEVSPDEALAWAVRLSDMPPHLQQQQLAHMSRPLRRKVIEVLREQIRSEREAAHPQPAPAPPVSPPSSYSYGSSLPNSTPGLAQGYGHGAPMPPTYSGAAVPRNSQDGSAQRISATFGQEPPVGAAATAAPAPVATDLLGMGHAQAGPAAPPPEAVEDLLGLDEAPVGTGRTQPMPAQHPQLPSQAPKPSPSASTPPSAPPPPPRPAVVHVDDMDDFFSGGTSRSASATTVAAAGAPTSSLAPAVSSQGKTSVTTPAGRVLGGTAVTGTSSGVGLADMLHDGDDGGVGMANVDVSGYEDLYQGEQGSADEPEVRRRLRAQREAAKHAKMKAALAEKKALEAEEAARRQEQVALKDQYKTSVEAWKNKHKGNIRGLLGSLHTVLWPDSGWAPVTVADLLEPAQIKKVYMRANLIVHPDKVRQRNGSAEQVAIADMVFDVLKDGWNAFR